MPLAPTVTIKQAKEWLRKRLHDGADCPVCNQRVQMYKRKLNSGMAHALFQIHNHAGMQWTRVQDMPDAPKGGDYAKLRFWGLLESSGDRAGDGNSAGLWRVTTKGRNFLYGKTKVPAYIGTYNNQSFPLPDRDIPEITIREALGKRFNYDELLGGGREPATRP